MTLVAEARAAAKAYGRLQALRGVDLALEEGEVHALLGTNGAGKTTLLSLLLGLRAPTRGSVELFGRDPRRPQTRRQVGCTPQDVTFPPTLRVAELIDLVRAHYDRPAPTRELVVRFGLEGLERRQAGGLSGGQRRRLALALAFAGNPRGVFLDEPTTGLDVEVRAQLWEQVRQYRRDGGTVLLTTHDLGEAEALATRVSIIRAGRLVASGSVADVRARRNSQVVRYRGAAAPAVPGLLAASAEDGWVELNVVDGGAAVAWLVRNGVELHRLEVRPATLEEAFLELAREAAA